MARTRFINPNDPEQPAAGVYRWFFRLGEREVTFYIGNSGGRRSRSVSKASTLKRGIMEVQRSCLSSDKGRTLDTDYIVGTAILHLKGKGMDCYWEHISDDPKDEFKLCQKFQPVLQDGTHIRADLRLQKADGTQWAMEDSPVAEDQLRRKLENYFQVASTDTTLSAGV